MFSFCRAPQVRWARQDGALAGALAAGPTIDVQGYLFLIRAAGRDKDANHAFDLLAELGNSGWSKALQCTITFSKRASV